MNPLETPSTYDLKRSSPSSAAVRHHGVPTGGMHRRGRSRQCHQGILSASGPSGGIASRSLPGAPVPCRRWPSPVPPPHPRSQRAGALTGDRVRHLIGVWPQKEQTTDRHPPLRVVPLPHRTTPIRDLTSTLLAAIGGAVSDHLGSKPGARTISCPRPGGNAGPPVALGGLFRCSPACAVHQRGGRRVTSSTSPWRSPTEGSYGLSATQRFLCS